MYKKANEIHSLMKKRKRKEKCFFALFFLKMEFPVYERKPLQKYNKKQFIRTE